MPCGIFCLWGFLLTKLDLTVMRDVNSLSKVPIRNLSTEHLLLLSFDREESLSENLKRLRGKRWASKLRDFIAYQRSLLVDQNPTLSEIPDREMTKDFNILHDLLLVLEQSESK